MAWNRRQTPRFGSSDTHVCIGQTSVRCIVNSRGGGGQRNSAPRSARHRPSNHRAGKAGRFRLHLWFFPLCICVRICFRTAGHGCQPAPGLPCALFTRGGSERRAKLGRNPPRECNGMSAMEVCVETERRGSIRRHCRLPSVILRCSSCTAGRASKGDGPAASRPSILRGSPMRRFAPHGSCLRMTGLAASLLQAEQRDPNVLSYFWIASLRSQ